MSKLFDYLTAEQTGDRKPILNPFSMVQVKREVIDAPYDYGYVYRVHVNLGANVLVSDKSTASSNVDFLSLVKNGVYRPLAEEVFGEFRMPLLNAQLALMQGKPQEASKLIDSVLDSMFKV